MTAPDLDALAASLTAGQRSALLSAEPLRDGRILVPAVIQRRRRWPSGVTDIYSVAFHRLTPLGAALRQHLGAAK
jgi:hypothetical protein